jgi:UDP-N-acetylmuramate dehydrogenase
MNGGSNRRSILENVTAVELINKKGEIEIEYADNLPFSYRTSPFQNDGRIVARVTLQLAKAERKIVRADMRKILASRRKKFPRKLPNCGSVFLSDPKMYDVIGPPGFAIEKVGLKGTQQGMAQISPLHANFIVNLGGASSDDVLFLIALARSEVFKNTQFLMDCEARYVSPNGDIIQAHVKADKDYSALYPSNFNLN